MDLDFDSEDCQDIYIRKLFYTICLPFLPVKKHTVFNKNQGRNPHTTDKDHKRKRSKAKTKADKLKEEQLNSTVMSILYQQHLYHLPLRQKNY